MHVNLNDPLACSLSVYTLAEWEARVETSDFMTEWDTPDTFPYRLTSTNTRAEMFTGERLQSLKARVSALEETYPGLNFRLAIASIRTPYGVEADIAHDRYLCTLVDLRNPIDGGMLTFVLPRLHAADRYTMLDPDLADDAKGLIVEAGIEAVFRQTDVTVAGILLAMPKRAASSGTRALFESFERRPVHYLEFEEVPGQSYFYFDGGDFEFARHAHLYADFREIAIAIDTAMERAFQDSMTMEGVPVRSDAVRDRNRVMLEHSLPLEAWKTPPDALVQQAYGGYSVPPSSARSAMIRS